MRIIGEIEHSQLKITIFKMGERTSIKFENALYEQTFKLGLHERLSNPDAVRQMVDAAFIERVLISFQHMHQTRMGAEQRAFPPDPNLHFENII